MVSARFVLFLLPFMMVISAQDFNMVMAMMKTYIGDIKQEMDRNQQILVQEYSDRISKLEQKIETLGKLK